MSQQAVITLSMKDQQTIQTLQRVETAFKKIEDRIDGITTKSGKAGSVLDGIFANATSDITKFAVGMAGVGSAAAALTTVVERIKAEYQNMVARQKGAADTQVDFETQLATTIRNIGPTMTGPEVKDMVMKLSREAVAEPAKAAKVLGDVASAKGVEAGTDDAKEVYKTSLATMRFAPELSADDQSRLAGTTMDIQKATGYDARQALGLASLTGGFARVTDLKSLADNVMPGAIKMMNLGGGSMVQNAALESALTQGIIDPTGEVSSTAGINLAKELRERMPKLPDTFARLEEIQKNPHLMQAFLQGSKGAWRKYGSKTTDAADLGRGQGIPAIEQLLRGQGTAWDEFQKASRGLGDQAAAGQEFDRSIRSVDAVTMASRLKRTIGSSVKGQQILDEQGGQTSILREGLMEMFQASGQSALAQDVDKVLFEGQTLAGGQLPAAVASERLRARAGELREDQYISGGGDASTGYSAYRAPKPEELRAATAFENLAKQIDALAKEMKENTAATKQNTKDNPQPAPRPTMPQSAKLDSRR